MTCAHGQMSPNLFWLSVRRTAQGQRCTQKLDLDGLIILVTATAQAEKCWGRWCVEKFAYAVYYLSTLLWYIEVFKQEKKKKKKLGKAKLYEILLACFFILLAILLCKKAFCFRKVSGLLSWLICAVDRMNNWMVPHPREHLVISSKSPVCHTWSGQTGERREISRYFLLFWEMSDTGQQHVLVPWVKGTRLSAALQFPCLWVGWLCCRAGPGTTSKLSSCVNSAFPCYRRENVTFANKWYRDMAGVMARVRRRLMANKSGALLIPSLT